MNANRHGPLVRAISLVGASSLVNMLCGVVRTKVAALLLGPAGIGLIGLLTNLMATASAVASLGLGPAGSREVAGAGEGEQAAASARRALLWLSYLLACVGALAMLALAEPLAGWALGDRGQAKLVRWLALGVAIGIVAVAQTSLLSGLRLVGKVAKVNIVAAVATTLLAVPLLLCGRSRAVIFYVLLSPFLLAVVGALVMRGVGGTRAAVDLAETRVRWRRMMVFGLPLMVAGVAGLLGQLLVRIAVDRTLGSGALGLFQASFAISSIYLAFLFGALWNDFYPRAVTVLEDPERLSELANNQTQVSLLLAGPLFVLLIGGAPLVLHLLYSSQFVPAAAALRWQVLGEFVRLLASPLAYVLLAAGRSRLIMAIDFLSAATFAGLTALLLPMVGLQGAGLAYLGSTIIFATSAASLAHWRHGLGWSPASLSVAGMALGGAIVTLLAGQHSLVPGLVVGGFSSLALAVMAIRHLSSLLPEAVTRWPLVRLVAGPARREA